MFNSLSKIIRNPSQRFLFFARRGFFSFMSDEVYLKKVFQARMGKSLDLNNPQTYNEKIQWLKIHDHNPLYIKLVDKYAVKEYVAEKIGEEYIIPTIGVWDNINDIDFSTLPDKFVLKCTHDSGGLVICKEKSSFNLSAARQRLNKSLKHNYYYLGREWPYKNVVPRIIAETYMEDEKSGELRDYKFFCFDGIVKALFIATDRQNPNEQTKFDFFDENFIHLPIKNGHPNASILPQKPICFEKMKQIASILSKGIPHVRVDLYEVNGKIYFGEMTFFHWSGFVPFDPEAWDDKFGSWIELPEKKHEKK